MGRKKADDEMVIYGGAYGGEVKSPFPPGVLAFLQQHEQATPELLERARAFWPERPLSDFDLRQTGPSEHKVLFVDKATGQEYRRDPSAALLDPDPRASGIECFVVDGTGGLCFLRPRGPRLPTTSEVLVNYVRGGQLS